MKINKESQVSTNPLTVPVATIREIAPHKPSQQWQESENEKTATLSIDLKREIDVLDCPRHSQRDDSEGGSCPTTDLRVESEFAKCDELVRNGAKAWVEAAGALARIRDEKLYEAKFKSFDEYCGSVKEMSRQYANRLIKAAGIHSEMKSIASEEGLPLLENEAQFRELGRLKTNEQRIEVYREAVTKVGESNGVTAAILREVIEDKGLIQAKPKSTIPSAAERLRMAIPLLQVLEPGSLYGETREAYDEILKLLTGES